MIVHGMKIVNNIQYNFFQEVKAVAYINKILTFNLITSNSWKTLEK